MICFDRDGYRFNYRVAGVAIHEGRVLVHRAEHESFWTLPGGRAELGETAEATIRREMREELSSDVDVTRLVWLAESFFEYEGSSYHELALYFLIRFPAGSMPLTRNAFGSSDGETKLRFEWCPLQGQVLANLPLFPTFLVQGLVDLPASVTHIVENG